MKLIFLVTCNIFIKYFTLVKTDQYQSNEISKSFIDQFFSEQKTVKVFSGICGDMCDWSSNKIVKEIFSSKNVLMYSDIKEDDDGSIFFTNYGYVAVTNVINRQILNQLSFIRNNGRWLLVLDSYTEFNEEFLKIAWNEYKLLNLVILSHDLNDTCVVSFFDPFEVMSVKSGVFYRYFLTDFFTTRTAVTKIDSRGRNLHNYTLNIYMDIFAETYAYPMYHRNGRLKRYSGIDGELLEAIRFSMNFNVNFMPILRENISIDERMKYISNLVEKKIVDFIPLATLLNKTLLTGVYPLYPLIVTEIVCGVATRHKPHTINIMYGFLDIPGTILFYSTPTIFSICLYFSIKRGKRENFWKYMLDILGVHFNNSRLLQKYQRIVSRLVLLCAFVLNLTIISTYQASIVSQLSVQSKTKQINTLNDLIRENITVLAIPAFYNVLESGVNNSTSANSIQEKFFKQLSYNTEIMNSVVFKKIARDKNYKNIGCLIRRYQALLFQSHYVDRETGENSIHVVKEKIATFPISFQVPKWSGFTRVMDEMLVRALEMGFIRKGNNDAKQRIWIRQMRTYKNLNHKLIMKPAPLTMENMKLTFILYFSFLAFVFLVFLTEIVYFKISKK